MKIIDLTQPLFDHMPVYPGDPEVIIEQVHTLEKKGWNLRSLTLTTHIGTHINAPVHMTPHGKSLNDLHLERFTGPCVLYKDGMLFGLPFQYFWWTRDWWHPQTITGTRIGLEDMVLGFASAGVAACLYIYVSGKEFTQKGAALQNSRLLKLGLLVMVSIGIMSFGQLLGYHSFISTTIALVCLSQYLWVRQIDTFLDAIGSGICMTVVTIPIFIAMQSVSNGYIEQTWYLDQLSGIRLIGIPVEDLVFYFFSGVIGYMLVPYLFGTNLKRRIIR